MLQNNKHLFLIAFSLCALGFSSAIAQIAMPMGASNSFSSSTAQGPKEYTIGGMSTTGANFLDEDLLVAVTGLAVGKKIKLPNLESLF